MVQLTNSLQKMFFRKYNCIYKRKTTASQCLILPQLNGQLRTFLFPGEEGYKMVVAAAALLDLQNCGESYFRYLEADRSQYYVKFLKYSRFFLGLHEFTYNLLSFQNTLGLRSL